MKIIEVKNVVYDYTSIDGSVRALRNVSLDIEKGQFVVLLGHNGSGKSTFAKLLNGLLVPTSGEVKVYGYDTKDDDTVFEIRKRVGMVFQNPDNQMIASIVEDDIAFGPENLGLEREEIGRRVDWALSAVGMSEHRKSTPFKMSGGQKQRIAIAGILALAPEVLVLDESTAMLDPEGRREVLKVAHELNREHGITVILITHYMDEAAQADRVLVMKSGEIVGDGTPREIFDDSALIESAGLAYPLSCAIANRLRDAGLELKSGIITQEELTEALCERLK